MLPIAASCGGSLGGSSGNSGNNVVGGIRRGGLPVTPAPSATNTPTPGHDVTLPPYLWLDKQVCSCITLVPKLI